MKEFEVTITETLQKSITVEAATKEEAQAMVEEMWDKTLSSEVGFKGICRKVLIFLLVGIGNIIDVQVIGSGSVMRTAVIFFYLSNEGISLIENAAHLGLPVPDKLKAVLEQLHDRAEKGGDE